ncbi:Protein SERAC1 [Nymphon striatum]|nr:Protein SERAC1 [Nymphon striatum]
MFNDNSEEKTLDSLDDCEYIYPLDNYDSPQTSLWSSHFLKNLKRTHSHRKAVRQQAVNNLSKCSELSDIDAYQLKRLCSQQTLVALARDKETNPMFFYHPPPSGILEKSYAHEECLKERPNCSLNEEFSTLLSLLPSTDDKCIKYFMEIVSKIRKIDIEDKGIWLEDEYKPTRSSKIVSDDDFEKFLLQTLFRHSMIAKQCQMIVDYGGLQLLTKIYKLRKNNAAMMCLIARIILSISVDQKFHDILYSGGWIGILHEWLQSANIQLSSIAASALANLDYDDRNQPVKYSDGIFLLSPFCRKNEEFNADIIFIHGIRGSAFRTWRQKDALNTKKANEEHTKCWPKDWLAEDTSNMRIIAVDYESEFSEWNVSCSYNKER